MMDKIKCKFCQKWVKHNEYSYYYKWTMESPGVERGEGFGWICKPCEVAKELLDD